MARLRCTFGVATRGRDREQPEPAVRSDRDRPSGTCRGEWEEGEEGEGGEGRRRRRREGGGKEEGMSVTRNGKSEIWRKQIV